MTSVPGPSSADSADVEAAARDYIEGWYAGDATRMDRALHLELLKRTRSDDPLALREVTRARMVEMTAAGGGGGRDVDVQIEIEIDDIFDGMAAARVFSPDFVDYLHLVRTSDGWRIANVLFLHRG